MAPYEGWREERRADCPAGLDLESYAFADAADSALAQHVASCTACREEVTTLRSERDAFLAQRPPAEFMRSLSTWQEPPPVDDLPEAPTPLRRPSARRSGVLLSAALVAAAALAALAVVPGRTHQAPADEHGVHLRGTPANDLTVYVSRGGQPAVPLQPHESLAEGDVLRFSVRATEPGYATLLNVDARGRVTRYLPQTDSPLRVPGGGKSTLLAGSIRLDGFVGEELLALVVASSPPDGAELVRAFERAYAASGGQLERLKPPDLPARVSLQIITKRAP